MAKVGSNIIEFILKIVAVVVAVVVSGLGLSNLFFNKKSKPIDTEKLREDTKDEFENKSATDIVDGLDNADDVRGTINHGGIRFNDRVRKVLQGFGDQGIDMGDSADSQSGDPKNK